MSDVMQEGNAGEETEESARQHLEMVPEVAQLCDAQLL
jgi:hypothetical protein